MKAGRGQVLRVGAGVDHAPDHEPDFGGQVVRAHLGFDAAETFGLDLFGEAGLPVHVDSSWKHYLEGGGEGREPLPPPSISLPQPLKGGWEGSLRGGRGI